MQVEWFFHNKAWYMYMHFSCVWLNVYLMAALCHPQGGGGGAVSLNPKAKEKVSNFNILQYPEVGCINYMYGLSKPYGLECQFLTVVKFEDKL